MKGWCSPTTTVRHNTFPGAVWKSFYSSVEEFLFKYRRRIPSDRRICFWTVSSIIQPTIFLPWRVNRINIWDEGKTHCLNDSQSKFAWGKAADSYYQNVLLLTERGLLWPDMCSGCKCWDQRSPPQFLLELVLISVKTCGLLNSSHSSPISWWCF